MAVDNVSRTWRQDLLVNSCLVRFRICEDGTPPAETNPHCVAMFESRFPTGTVPSGMKLTAVMSRVWSVLIILSRQENDITPFDFLREFI